MRDPSKTTPDQQPLRVLSDESTKTTVIKIVNLKNKMDYINMFQKIGPLDLGLFLLEWLAHGR